MSVQFLRSCILVVSDNAGNTEDLSLLRITFRVTHGTIQTPRKLVLKIWNPSPITINNAKSFYTSISLSIGYQKESSVLFEGKIQQIRDGQENPVDTFLEIIAVTGGMAYAEAVSSAVLPAGWSYNHAHSQIVEDMAKKEKIGKGDFPSLTGSAPRPKIMYGMTRDHCRVLAHSTSAAWNIDDNGVSFYHIPDMVKPKSQNEEAIILSPKTGLIGVPVQTPDGVQATCLMNARLKRNVLVQIKDAKTLDAQADVSYSAINGGNQVMTNENGVERRSIIGTSPTGTYRIAYVDHEGDTRDNVWYSTICCIAVDVSAVQTQRTIGAF